MYPKNAVTFKSEDTTYKNKLVPIVQEKTKDIIDGESQYYMGAITSTLNVKILLVEDIPIIQVATKFFLQALGCEVEIAASGREAIKKMNEEFTLIFMDIELPDMTGIEVARVIRQKTIGVTVPIIALTASPINEIMSNCLAAGMNDVATKPVSITILNKILKKYIGK